MQKEMNKIKIFPLKLFHLSKRRDIKTVTKKTLFVIRKHFLYVSAWYPPANRRSPINISKNSIPWKRCIHRAEIDKIETIDKLVDRASSVPYT
ncbi:hypothetical protein AALD01_09670 [Oscillospiraceae bacterium 21-37]